MWKMLFAVASILMIDVRPADACSCMGPRAWVFGEVDNKVTIPRNGQIRVTWPADGVKLDDTTFSLVLDANGGPLVVLDHKTITAGAANIAVVWPKAPLLAGATYHLMVAETKHGKPSELVQVVTTKDVDSTRPTWKGVTASYFLKYEPQCCMCQTGGPEIDLDVDARDDVTGEDQLVYGVWSGDTPFDPKAPMLTLSPAYRGRVAIGSMSICSPANFDVPGKAKSIKLHVAPIDLAGNIGVPSSVTVDLAKPVKEHP
jgi:hypothetical protein